ncbi:MAG: hypothetical protein U0840_25830 [Gemmataceae bacterium]
MRAAWLLVLGAWIPGLQAANPSPAPVETAAAVAPAGATGNIPPTPTAPPTPFAVKEVTLPVAPVAPVSPTVSPCRFLWEQDLQTIRWLLPDARPSLPNLLDSTTAGTSACDLFNGRVGESTFLCLDGLVRGYYLNDQRIEWSGVEATLGAEAILRPAVYYQKDGWTVSAEGEFFLNQPFGRSILQDPARAIYRSNFEVDTFEIFQLYAQASFEDFYLRIGKSRTPFGAYSSPMFTNRLIDAPFIRTDVIAWTETGAFFHYQPGLLSVDVAITNGEPELDTNSSKAIIGRIALEADTWGVGLSGKYQDGTSSEQQKEYNNHIGIDAHMCLAERWIVYGEGIYDQYGFHRNFYQLGQNTPDALGKRSIYRREVFKGDKQPVSGYGYYVAGGYRGDKLVFDLSYGSYFPEKLGILGHDDPIHRAVLKLAYNITMNLQIYGVGLIENKRDTIYPLNLGPTHAYLGGMQFMF